MLNRATLTLPAKVKAAAAQPTVVAPANAAATAPEPMFKATADPRVRYPLLRSLWQSAPPANALVATVRHRMPMRSGT